MKNRTTILLVLVILVVSCSDKEMLIPRPIANLRVPFPERSYQTYESTCPYYFDLASYMSVKPIDSMKSCHIDVDLGQFNGILHLSYVPVENNLADLIAYSLDRVREHQVKASAIQDSMILNADSRVFGTFFELYGNAATPFQFYFTDSTKHFIKGTVYFNATPNFDSIYPVLQYVKQDLIQLVNSNQWK